MRKFGKILAVVLTLCVLVTALTLVISANAEEGTPNTFIVDDIYYSTWDKAVEATKTATDKTIYLGGNITAESSGTTVTVSRGQQGDTITACSSENVTKPVAFPVTITTVVDLNGFSITQNFSGSLFHVTADGADITITGSGKLLNVGELVGTTAGSASSDIVINGTGNGIEITNRDNERYTFFKLNHANDTLTFKGKIHIKPCDNGTRVVTTSGSALTITDANIVVDAPNSTSWTENRFVMFANDQTVTVENSYVEMDYGVMFQAYTDYPKTLALGTYYATSNPTNPYSYGNSWNTLEVTTTTEFSVSNSTLISKASNSAVAANATSVGAIYAGQSAGFNMTFDNCHLQGSSAFQDIYTYMSSGLGANAIGKQLLTFNNCTFVSNEYVHSSKAALFCGALNVDWNGGYINTPDLAYGTYEYCAAKSGWLGVQFRNVVVNCDEKLWEVSGDNSIANAGYGLTDGHYYIKAGDIQYDKDLRVNVNGEWLPANHIVGTPTVSYIDASEEILTKIKINLSLYSKFHMNFYVPTNVDGVTDAALQMAESGVSPILKGQVTLDDGVVYDVYAFEFGVADIQTASFKLKYKYNDADCEKTLEYSIPTYANAVMSITESTESAKMAKTMIANLVNYACKVYEYADGDLNADGYKKYETLLAAATQYVVNYEDSDFEVGGAFTDRLITDNAGGAYSIYFSNEAPAFVFKPTAENVTNVKYQMGNTGVLTANQDGDTFKFLTGDTSEQRVSDMTADIKVIVSVEGAEDAEYTYNLATYINALVTATEKDTEAIEAAKALYAFATTAKAYLDANLAK